MLFRKENRELSVRNTQLQEQHDEDVRIHNKQLEMIKQGLLANKEKNDQEHEELLNLTKIPKIYSIGSSRKRSFFKYFLDFTKNNKSKSEDDDDEEDEEEEEPPRKIQNINDEETTPEQSSEMPLSDSETVSEPSTVEPSKDETIPLPVKIVSVNNQVEELDNTQNSQADQCSVKSTDIISNDVAQLINQILEAPRVSFYKENLDDEYFMDIDFSEMSSSKMPVKSSEISTKANKALDGLREDPLKTILKSIETGMTSKPNEMIDTAVVKENLCDSNMEDVSEETSAKYPAITHTSSDFLYIQTHFNLI